MAAPPTLLRQHPGRPLLPLAIQASKEGPGQAGEQGAYGTLRMTERLPLPMLLFIILL